MSSDLTKTSDQIQTELLENIPDTYQKTTGYPVYDITRSFAMSESDLYTKINDVYKFQDVDNLSGDDLTKFVYQRKGIRRKLATFAKTQLMVVGNGTILKGALFATDGNIQFAADEETLISGTGIVNLTCVASGNVGNVIPGTINKMPVTIAGINSVANLATASGGYDEESDDELRARYYIALQTPATSGNKYHYQQWALSVTGVGAVKIYPLWEGPNTVQIVIIDSNGLPASDELVQAVQKYIDPNMNGDGAGEAPIGCICIVVKANALEINISCNGILAEGYVKSQVEENIQLISANYLKTVAFKQGYVSYAHIGATILESEGLQDYNNLLLNDGVSNVTIPDKSVCVAGTVTVN